MTSAGGGAPPPPRPHPGLFRGGPPICFFLPGGGGPRAPPRFNRRQSVTDVFQKYGQGALTRPVRRFDLAASALKSPILMNGTSS